MSACHRVTIWATDRTFLWFRLKNANPAKQEQARLEVENAEDDLVQKTEVAITLMKTVLENVCVCLLQHNHNIDVPAAGTYQESE